MTIQDRQLVEDVYARGIAAFEEQGVTQEAAKAFLDRKDVQQYLVAIDLDAGNQEVMLGRARYAAKRSLMRMIPDSLQILADALRGPEYVRNEETKAIEFDARGNPMIKELPPTLGQREAAAQVLDRLGVGGTKQLTDATGSSVTVNTILNQAGDSTVELDYGPETLQADQKAIMRERVRIVIEKLAGTVLPRARQMLDKTLKKPKAALRRARQSMAPRALPAPKEAVEHVEGSTERSDQAGRDSDRGERDSVARGHRKGGRVGRRAREDRAPSNREDDAAPGFRDTEVGSPEQVEVGQE